MIVRGRCISPGCFEGVAHFLDAAAWLEAARSASARSDAAGELERLRRARDEACSQLARFEAQLVRQGRREEADIFAAHRALMNDPALESRVQQGLDAGRSAEAALAETISSLHAEFGAHRSDMLRDKAPDLLDIGHRWLRCLDPEAEVRASAGRPVVLITASLHPSELVWYANSTPCAVLTADCSGKSHAAILARSFGIPVVSGIAWPLEGISEGEPILVDADRGIAVVAPTPAEQGEVDGIRRTIGKPAKPAWKPRQPVTRDGTRIHLRLNISDAGEAGLVHEFGAAGVGLFRTEFFYMTRDTWPTEDETHAMVLGVAEALGGARLQIRLADFGADKCPGYAQFPVSRNPSLGLRGIRLLLEYEEILAPQVRAIARLAEEHAVAVLVPMLDGVDTLEHLLGVLERILGRPRDALPFELGAMVEVPAAALSIRAILERVDRVSIGLNDLTQYVMAADREDESVERHHDPLTPSLLGLVHDVVQAASHLGKGVSVCGELAGDASLIPILLGLGVRDLSVSRPDYVRAVETIETLAFPDLSDLGRRVLAAGSGREVRDLLGVP